MYMAETGKLNNQQILKLNNFLKNWKILKYKQLYPLFWIECNSSSLP